MPFIIGFTELKSLELEIMYIKNMKIMFKQKSISKNFGIFLTSPYFQLATGYFQ